MPRNNTIRGAVYGAPAVEVEYLAGGLTPIKAGMLLHLTSTGLVIPEDATSQAAEPPSQTLIASENRILGKSISDDWGDTSNDYQPGDLVSCFVARRGDKFYGWLAPGEGVLIGEPLLGSGAGVAIQWGGSLRRGATPIVDILLQCGYSTEVVNNLSGSSPVRVMVEVH